MMTITELILLKQDLGFSNKQIAEGAKVPLGTVQKIFSRETDHPRYETLRKLSTFFEEAAEKKHASMGYPGFRTAEQADRDHAKENLLRESSSYGSLAKQIGENTIDDYMALPDGIRMELIDGVFYDMAAPSILHQQLIGILHKELLIFVEENQGDCLPLLSPLDVQLDPEDEHTIVQPDVLVVCDRDKVRKEKIVGAPDLVIEVVSPSNWHMDVTIKMKKYEACGVREYWIVLPDHKKVIVHHFEKKKEKMEYTFEDTIPVGIWDGRCKIDFKEIRDRIGFLLGE